MVGDNAEDSCKIADTQPIGEAREIISLVVLLFALFMGVLLISGFLTPHEKHSRELPHYKVSVTSENGLAIKISEKAVSVGRPQASVGVAAPDLKGAKSE